MWESDAGLGDLFDFTFKKFVFSGSFCLPNSVKDLRIFTEQICMDVFKKINHKKNISSIERRELSQWQSISSGNSKSCTQTQYSIGNAPIGLENLSKTFDIICELHVFSVIN